MTICCCEHTHTARERESAYVPERGRIDWWDPAARLGPYLNGPIPSPTTRSPARLQIADIIPKWKGDCREKFTSFPYIFTGNFVKRRKLHKVISLALHIWQPADVNKGGGCSRERSRSPGVKLSNNTSWEEGRLRLLQLSSPPLKLLLVSVSVNVGAKFSL